MNVRRIATWTVSIVLALAVMAFLAFLYFIPPFTLQPPKRSARRKQRRRRRSLTSRIRRPARSPSAASTSSRRQAAWDATSRRGPRGQWDQYLAGGAKTTFKGHGTFVSANLTPDPQTGLARRSDDEVKRVLRSGVSADGGRLLWYRAMPWAWFSNWTEEDRHAVVVYLRNINAVAHRIPPPSDQTSPFVDLAAIEQASGFDSGTKP